MSEAKALNDSTGTVAGIDVGGPKKGCHIAILRGCELILSERSRDPGYLARLCVESGALAVGIDSPCLWGREGAGRFAEKALAKERIFCFSTPSRERAIENAAGFYNWMLEGERVYQALSSTHPLVPGPRYPNGMVSFETFPHAICCSLLGTEVASAKKKRQQRRELLEQEGVDTRLLKSIDEIDAGLCALAAKYFVQGNARAYGDAEGGYIFVPGMTPEFNRR